MKKMFKLIGKFFHHIGLFFDKWLITPITKLFLIISSLFKDNNKLFDKYLSKKSTLIIISLILAFVVFMFIDNESTVMTDQYAEILYNQKVNAVYNDELYVVEGLPKTVDITLIGQKRHIFLAKQSPSNGATVDLTGLKPGTHKVTLKYSQRLKSLDYKLDPSQVMVTIYEKVSQTKSITYDVLHQDDLDSKLSIDSINLDRNEVIVKGAEYKLNKVASVKALVDVKYLNNPKAGVINLKKVPLVAYDTDGKVVDVEIVPKTVNAKIKISSPSKEVPVNVIPKGDLAFGKSIKSITSNISKVTIYGESSVLSKINSIDAEIDVSGLEKNKDYNITLTKPTGVNEISNDSLSVKVIIDNSTTKEFDNIQISTENLDSKYKVQALSEKDSKVNIVVEGSEDAINKIENTSIKAYIDLKDLGVGEHEVKVQVTGSDNKLIYKSKTKTVKVKILEK